MQGVIFSMARKLIMKESITQVCNVFVKPFWCYCCLSICHCSLWLVLEWKGKQAFRDTNTQRAPLSFLPLQNPLSFSCECLQCRLMSLLLLLLLAAAFFNIIIIIIIIIHHIPKCQQFYYSFIVMLIGPRCLDHIFGIQKNF